MRYLHYSLALGATGLFTGLAYHNLSKKHPFEISASPPVNSNKENVLSTCVTSQNLLKQYGLPSYDSLIYRRNYVLSYDRKNKIPNWTLEHLTSDMLKAEACGRREHSRFQEDDTIPEYFRSTPKDYANSGYDKGHLAASNNYPHSQQEMDETFVMSNIVPQNSSFNRGKWKSLENHVRVLVGKHGSVYVCTGPLYLPRSLRPGEVLLSENQPKEQMRSLGPGVSLSENQPKEQMSLSPGEVLLSENQPKEEKRSLGPGVSLSENQPKEQMSKKEQIYHINKAAATKDEQPKKYIIHEVIGENNVAVPTHFFKIILWKNKKNSYDMEAYVLPNQKIDRETKLEVFMFPKDAIERAAGLLFFHKLPSNEIRKINGEYRNVEGSGDGPKNKLLEEKENTTPKI